MDARELIARRVALELHDNTLVNLDRQGIATGFGFLSREAAFEIGETPIEQTAFGIDENLPP